MSLTQKTAAGKAISCVLNGQMGIGKTRLKEELEEAAVARRKKDELIEELEARIRRQRRQIEELEEARDRLMARIKEAEEMARPPAPRRPVAKEMDKRSAIAAMAIALVGAMLWIGSD